MQEAGYASFSQFYEHYTSDAKASIRRQQYKLALEGNERMLIKMGETYLNQKEDDVSSQKNIVVPQFNFFIKNN